MSSSAESDPRVCIISSVSAVLQDVVLEMVSPDAAALEVLLTAASEAVAPDAMSAVVVLQTDAKSMVRVKINKKGKKRDEGERKKTYSKRKVKGLRKEGSGSSLVHAGPTLLYSGVVTNGTAMR